MATSRIVYMYKYTLMTAEQMIEQASKGEEKNNSLSAIVFCAFTLEGFLNHVGAELIEEWNNLFESLAPKAKLVLITDKFKIKFSFGEEPFQSFSKVFQIRNQLAHPKTKKHNYQGSDKKLKIKVGEKEWLADEWEIYSDLQKAKKIVFDTKEIIKRLEDELNIEKIPDFLLSEHI